MKIGNQAINGLKLVSGVNKQIRPFLAGGCVAVFVRKTFQRAGAGGADGKNPLSLGVGGVYYLGRFGRNFAQFR